MVMMITEVLIMVAVTDMAIIKETWYMSTLSTTYELIWMVYVH